jgi:hypothetical protein
VSANSVNIVHSVNKVVNPHKDYNHYVGGGPPQAVGRGWEIFFSNKKGNPLLLGELCQAYHGNRLTLYSSGLILFGLLDKCMFTKVHDVTSQKSLILIYGHHIILTFNLNLNSKNR